MVDEDDYDDERTDPRRATRRLPLQAMVTYHLDGQEYGNLAADVSHDGMFIRTYMPPPHGTRLDLEVRLPREFGGYRVQIEAQVVRVVDGPDPRQNGMGVRFLAIRATGHDAVRYLVARIFRLEVLERCHPLAGEGEDTEG